MPSPETCALCTSRNNAAHERIQATLDELRAAQVAHEVTVTGSLARLDESLAHLSGRRNGRGWWRVPVLAVGLGAVVGAASWGAIALIDHGARLAVLERPAAAAAVGR
jgi:hypothetical protein